MQIIEKNIPVNEQLKSELSLSSLSQVERRLGRRGQLVLTNLPEFKVSERHAFLMARKTIDHLRKSEQKAKKKLRAGVNELASRSMGRKAFDHIRKMMLSQVGAFELGRSNRKESVVYFLEVGDHGDDIVYLCSSSCQRKRPIETWASIKHVALTRHALERAFLRGCIWAKGQAVCLAHIVKELFDIHVSHIAYQNQYDNQCRRLIQQGWNINFSDARTQYILRHDDTQLPVVMTVYKAEEETPEGGIAKMIPPEGSVGNPKLVASLDYLGQQYGMALSA